MADRTTRAGAAAGLLPAQRAAVGAFGVVGLVLGVLVLADAPFGVRRWLMTPPIAALCLLALAARPRTPTQRLVTVALGLSALGDAFFVGFIALPDGVGRLAGIGTFALAYLVLVAAFWRGRPRPAEAALVLPFAAVAVALCLVLWPYLPAAMVGPVVVFAAVIVLMVWTTGGMLRRGWFAARVARLAATTGVTLFASDALVALQMFHPAFDPAPPASEATIRLTYLAGWLLMLLVVWTPPAQLSRLKTSTE